MEDIISIIQNLGFPVAISLVLAWTIFKLGTKMLADHASVLANKDKLIETQNTLIGNHIDHLTDALTAVVNKLEKTESSFNVGIEKIVTSIEHQSDMMREVLSRDCPLKK